MGYAGVFLAVRAMRNDRLLDWLEANGQKIWRWLYLSGLGLVVVCVFGAHYGVVLNNWDPRYPLTLANELSQDRPWQGLFQGTALYSNALSENEVKRLSRLDISEPEGIKARNGLGAVVLYPFASHRVR